MRTSLSEEVQNILNEQIRIEAVASAKYLAMASWCDERGYENSANFFYHQSDEERKHMLKIFHYVADMGGKAASPEVAGINHEFASLREVFETALEQEIGVTHAINRIVDTCRKVKDFGTEQFIDWFVEEQREEEFVARRIIELFDVIGEEGQGLYFIDKEIPNVKYDA
jgi:ferritin